MTEAAGASRGELPRPPVLAAVRRTVRGLLEASPGWSEASPALKRDVAHSLVSVGMMAADLAANDARLTAEVAPASPPAPVLAEGQAFAATKAAGQAIADIRKALDFPEYVTSLITGVFQAITRSNLDQITQLSDLLDNVAKTQEEFASDNIRDRDVIQWAIGKMPFLTSTDGSDLVPRPGTDLVEQRAAIRSAVGATDAELSALDESDLLATLGPLIQRRIGRERQQILGTLVQMGLQRIVVDEGRLHASMDMRVDTRSAQESQRTSSDQFSFESGASGSFGFGAWGASAHVNVGINKVSSEQDVQKDEIATRAGLRSTVDLAFRTEQVPLDRMVGPAARVKLDNNSRVPVSVSDANSSLLSPVTATPPPPTALPPTLTPSQPATSSVARPTATPPTTPPSTPPTTPTRTNPAPTDPAPTYPAPTTPAPTNPAPTNPAPATPAARTSTAPTPASSTPPASSPAPTTPPPSTPAPAAPRS